MNKKNKIGVITLHNSYNYGAVLQAYATCEYIKSIGYKDVELINYENKYEKKSKEPLKFIFSGTIKSQIKKFIQYVIFGKNRHLKKGFKRFNNSMKKSNYVEDVHQIENQKYDILISGSDQIWNPVIFDGIDPIFFLNFSNKSRKISISSSAGSYIFSQNEMKDVSGYLNKYDAISVREESLKKQLEKNIDKEIFVSTDPTLLLSKLEWENRLKSNNRYNENESEYILLYLVDANLKVYEKEIISLKQRIKLPIWIITPYKFKFKNIDKNIVSASPEDFISLVSNATYIITNSFHGVIFSTNFSKPFVALENHKNPKRTFDYLKSICLENRIVKNESEARKISIMFEYQFSKQKLNGLVDNTKKWIIKNIDK